MIKPILNRYLSSEEFYTLVNSIKRAINASMIEEALKQQLNARLDKELLNFDSAINRLKKNPLTLVKEQKDHVIDSRFLGFRCITEAYSHHWDEDKKESAIAIIEVIRRHGWSIYNDGYSVQSAAMNSLTHELQKEPAASYIQKTGTQEWLNQLISAIADFEKTNHESEELDAQEKPLITTGRKALYKDLSTTLNYLESQAEFNSNDALTHLIDNINQIITDITASAKARNTRKHSGDNPDE